MLWISSRAWAIAILLSVALANLPQGTAWAQSKGNGVQVRAALAGPVVANSGQTISLSFAVTNNSALSEEFVESLTLPTGWVAINPVSNFTLEPQSTQAAIFAVLVPAGTAAGAYELNYSVQSQRDPAIRDIETVKVDVLLLSSLKFMTDSNPGSVIAGDSYDIPLLVVNEGNAETRLQISVKSSDGSMVKLDTESITLPAGGNRSVLAKIKTDSKLKRRVDEQILFEAQQADDKTVVLASLSLSVEVVPSKSFEVDKYRRLPVKMSSYLMTSAGSTTSQLLFSGAGNLDEKGTKSVNFMLRATDTQNEGAFGLLFEQYLNYSSKNLDVRVGDQSYSLSRLTDYYSYGRGLAVDIRQPKGADFGAYFVKKLDSASDERATGLYYSKQINPDLSFKINAVDKRMDLPLDCSDRLMSLEASAKLFRNTNLQMEFGTSHTNRDTQSTDKAYSLRMNGRLGTASYSLARVYAGPHYYGYYHDVDSVSGSLSFPLSKRLRLSAVSQQWAQNLELDSLQGASPEEQRSQMGLSYAVASGINLSLDYDWTHRYDVQSPATYNYLENTFQLGAGFALGKFNLQGYLNSGSREDTLTGLTDRVNRYSLYSSYRPSARDSYSIAAQFGDGLYSTARLNSIGFYGQWKFTDQLTCALLYDINKAGSISRPDVNQLSFNSSYVFDDGSRVELRWRDLGGISGTKNGSVYLSYERSFGLPIGIKTNTGGIKGRITDAEAAGNPGIARAIVIANGVKAVSDAKGNFEFKSLTVGKCSVSVDKSSIGLERVATIKLPATVDIVRNKSAKLELSVTRSASLTGKISIWSRGVAVNIVGGDGIASPNTGNVFVEGDGAGSKGSESAPAARAEADGTGMIEGAGLGNMLVEMASDTGLVVRTLSNEKGLFSFEDLVPGKYKLRVYDNNLPVFHEMEQKQLDISLEPGGKANVVFKVIPILRSVEMLDSGE